MLVCLQVAGLLGFTTVLGTRDCAPLPSTRCAALVIWLVAHMTRCASLHVDVALPWTESGWRVYFNYSRLQA